MNDIEKKWKKETKRGILMHFDEAPRFVEIFAVIQHMRILYMARAFFPCYTCNAYAIAMASNHTTVSHFKCNKMSVCI